MTNAEPADLDQNLFALFARSAARLPDAIAVTDDQGATTYADLLGRASVIADVLTQRGLRAEQPVGVLMKRTADLVAALLGILGAGGCYVPIDPDDPPARARRIVDGAHCQLVLAHGALLAEFEPALRGPHPMADAVELVTIERCLDATHRAPLAVAPGGRRLAYILFTSGSTGLPKGVEVEHQSVVNLLLAVRNLFGFTASDRYLATSTIGFDISVAEIFLPLITGGTVVLRDRQLVLEPHRLARVIQDQRVTVFQTGPSVWSVLLAEVPKFPRLRVAVSTGEAITPALARRLVGVAETVWNLYGPTETTVWATAHRLELNAADLLAPSAISAPIGLPLAKVTVRVLNEHRAAVAPGTQGELWIGGEAVARGYCHNAALTRERFVDLGEGSGTGFLTGDLVLQDEHRTIHYFGRNDDQIKVRGVRIEPLEVELALLTHPGVAQVAATWFAGSSDARSIVAAVVRGPGLAITAVELHHFLVPVLPSAMIPSRFIFCEALPRSPSGKIDRAAIRTRVAEQSTEPATAAGRDGLTETERALIKIWESTLSVNSIRRDDHFFSIGGDSLSAITMVLEVEATFHIAIPFRVVFEASTLDRLAEFIDRAQAQRLIGNKASVPIAERDNPTLVFPLAQQGGGTPLFFVGIDLRMGHPGMWNLDCSLYAVAQWALGRGFVRANSVEELARIQLDSIRAIQAHGPYRVAGYSFGGLVALEIAQQLRQSGETVELLFLLDPAEPFPDSYAVRLLSHGPSVGGAPERLGARVKRHLRQAVFHPRRALCHVGFNLVTAWHIYCRRPAWEWLCNRLVHFYGRHPNRLSTYLLPKDRGPGFWHNAQRLGRVYNPQPYEGEVLAIFTSRQGSDEMWRQFCDATADSHIIDSPHLGMFDEPALSHWRQLLRARLEGES